VLASFGRKSLKFLLIVTAVACVFAAVPRGMLAQDENPASEVSTTETESQPSSGETPLDEDAATEPGPTGVMGFLGEFFANPLNLILLSAILFMFIVVRPQQRQAKELQAALAALKKNDKVVTTSGIHGVVISASDGDPTIVIRIDENSGARLTINREAVSRVVDPGSKSDAKPDAKK